MASVNIDAMPGLEMFGIFNTNTMNIDAMPGLEMMGIQDFVEIPPPGSAEWSLVSPAEFSLLKKRDAIVILVEYYDFNLLDLVIIVKIKSKNIFDVVYYNGGFSAKYAATSSKTPVSGGFHFSIRRDEGWPVSLPTDDDIELFVVSSRSAIFGTEI